MDIKKPITMPWWKDMLLNVITWCAGALMAQQLPRIVPRLATYGVILLPLILLWASRRERQSH